MLRCPRCLEELKRVDQHYECLQHHCYDISKRGYVNLLSSNQKGSGDDVDMIRARTRFLSHQYYEPLQKMMVDQIQKYSHDVIVDAGCGQGYYTNEMAKVYTNSSIYGFDLSKSGVDEACKARTHTVYAVANVFHMPIAMCCVDVLTSIFTPFDWNENARVLKENGIFIKVGPGPKHLLDVKQVVYEEVYENPEQHEAHEAFERMEDKMIEYRIQLQDAQDIWALFQMTPYYWKSPKQGSDRLKKMDTLDTIVQFHVEVYRKRPISANL